MIATKCVPFSLCSDMGGGMRYPASFCGVYTMKPTAQRISKKGLFGMSS
jgi:amidase